MEDLIINDISEDLMTDLERETVYEECFFDEVLWEGN